MEIVWRNPKIAADPEVSVFNIGYIEEPHRVRVYYLSSFGPDKLRQQYELVVTRKGARFNSECLTLSATASVR
jgi:hypothetical protein